ncbi:MAG TPA: hypothetical protein VFX02_00185 [Gammaproteobacteria bacterium]|nr:hypothetical protein [Gammaproteobacteria bacterium]
MNLKFFTRSFVSRIMPKTDRGPKQEVQPMVMTFSPKEPRAIAYTVRTIHSCERHRTRSLRELANCSMYCTKTCMLADMHEDA